MYWQLNLWSPLKADQKPTNRPKKREAMKWRKEKKRGGRKLDTPSILLLNQEYCLSWSVQCALYKQAVYNIMPSVLELELAELIKVSKFQKQIFLFSFEPKKYVIHPKYYKHMKKGIHQSQLGWQKMGWFLADKPVYIN